MASRVQVDVTVAVPLVPGTFCAGHSRLNPGVRRLTRNPVQLAGLCGGIAKSGHSPRGVTGSGSAWPACSAATCEFGLAVFGK
jgi:hypothetical protein